MGQKVNPIAVRLNFNRFSDSSWFSDYYYSRLIYQDFNFRQYLNSIKQPNANKLGFRAARCIIHHYPKRILIHLFCLSDPRLLNIENEYKSINEDCLNKLLQGNRFLESGSFSIKNNYSATSKENFFSGKAEVSLYWLKSSILDKKRALINLHRGIAKSFPEPCKQAIPFDQTSSKELHGLSQSKRARSRAVCHLRAFVGQSNVGPHTQPLRPGWLSRLVPIARANSFDFPSILFSKNKKSHSISSEYPDGKNLRHGTLWSAINNISDVGCHLRASDLQRLGLPKEPLGASPNQGMSHTQAPGNALQAGLGLDNNQCTDRFLFNYSVPRKADILKGPDFHLRARSHFSFYAMHYYFMRKTNSVYLSKHSFVSIEHATPITPSEPSLHFDEISTLRDSNQEMGALQAKGAVLSEPSRRDEGAKAQSRSVYKQLSFSANTIWPSLHHIYENRNRAVWQLLSLDCPTAGEGATEERRTHGLLQRSDSPLGSFLKMKSTSAKNKRLAQPENKNVIGLLARHSRTLGVSHVRGPSKIMKSFAPLLSNVNFILSENSFGAFISLRTIKVNSVFQSAFLVAQEVACKLEQKKSFRIICRLIFQQISSCNYIKGIRIACSGRLNGAEIAKTECRKFGETSLHIFSDKIDYAHTRASTPYGILGIKVWISYI
jgi:ribosomal protein S3